MNVSRLDSEPLIQGIAFSTVSTIQLDCHLDHVSERINYFDTFLSPLWHLLLSVQAGQTSLDLVIIPKDSWEPLRIPQYNPNPIAPSRSELEYLFHERGRFRVQKVPDASRRVLWAGRVRSSRYIPRTWFLSRAKPTIIRLLQPNKTFNHPRFQNEQSSRTPPPLHRSSSWSSSHQCKQRGLPQSACCYPKPLHR